MIVSCKMTSCPYYDNRGFCAKKDVLNIDEMGMCSVLWKNGQQRLLQMPFTKQNYPREDVIIIDVAATEVSDIIESKEEEEAESRLENPINGDAATLNNG